MIGRHVSWLALCAALGQLAIFLSLPLLTRYFDPRAMGDYTLFLGAVTIASILAGLRYDSAVVLPKSDTVASALVAAVVLSALAVSTLAVFAAAVYCAAHGIGFSAFVPTAATLFAITVLAGGVQRASLAWYTRRRLFGLLGMSQFLSNPGIAVAQLVTGYAGRRDSVALMAAHASIVSAVAAAGLWPLISERLQISKGWRTRAIVVAMRRYSRFPKYMILYGLMSQARERFVQIMMGAFAGSGQVGRFGLASRLAGAPNTLLYSAISPVFYSYASRNSKVFVMRVAIATVEVLCVLLFLPYCILGMEADVLAGWVLGGKWAGTESYLRWLALPMFVLAVTCWMDRFFDLYARQRAGLVLESSFTVLLLVVTAALYLSGTSKAVVPCFALLSTAYYVLYAFVAVRSAQTTVPQLRAAALSIAAVALLSIGALAICHLLGDNLQRLLAGALAYLLILSFWGLTRGREVLRLLLSPPMVGQPSKSLKQD
jgi:O-antigen/teichoic acid export membrane protein